MDWNKYFMTMVYLVSMKSKDSKTKIGAVIIGRDKGIRSTGFNGLPRGVVDDMSKVEEELPFQDRNERPEKYFWYEHAERNAIYNSANVGIPLKDCIMYTQGVPCADCGRAIIQSGINHVIVHQQWEDNGEFMSHQKWVESAGRTMQMFKEAGIGLVQWDGKIAKEIYGMSDGKIIV